LNAEGATIVVITHDMELAGAMPRRLGVRDGAIDDARP
jgi:putative ABC transport system ATP-binding protein